MTQAATPSSCQGIRRLKEFYGWFNPALIALGGPGPEGRAAELSRLIAVILTFLTQVHRRSRRERRSRSQPRDAGPAEIGTPEKFYRQLGAGLRRHDRKSLDTRAAPRRSNGCSSRYRMVVVVFYSPGSSVDAAAVIEARAAALDTGAGFVPVNVKREKQVAAIAIGYEVPGTPTVLVFTRGPKLRSHFDRSGRSHHVAQAVPNARR